MRRFRASFQEPCTPLRSTRRHPEKVSASASKCRAGALRLRLFCFRLPRHRDNTERGDAVALPTQHAKAEAVEGEALATLRDRTRLVDHETRDRGCLFIGQ